MQTHRYTERGQSKCKRWRIHQVHSGLYLMLASCIRSRHLVPQTQEHCLQGNLAQDSLIESDWTWALVSSYVSPQQRAILHKMLSLKVIGHGPWWVHMLLHNRNTKDTFTTLADTGIVCVDMGPGLFICYSTTETQRIPLQHWLTQAWFVTVC